MSGIGSELKIPYKYLVRDEATKVSSFCMVVNNSWVRGLLLSEYGRSNLCIKLVGYPDQRELKWQKSPISEIIKIQNIFAWHGLAPRVVDLVMVLNIVM